MKLNNVKISYYKTFSQEYNNLQVEDDITVIVGKNESGKSNLLEILSNISLLQGIDQKYLDKVNRKYRGEKVNIILDFKLNDYEITKIIKSLKIEDIIKNNIWNKFYKMTKFMLSLYIGDKDFEKKFLELDLKESFYLEMYESLKKIFRYIDDEIIFDEITLEDRKDKFNQIVLDTIFKDWINICNLVKLNSELEIKFNDSVEIELNKKNIEEITDENIKSEINEKIIFSDIFFEYIEYTKSYFEENYKMYTGQIIEEKLGEIKQNLKYTRFILKEKNCVQIDGAFKFYFEFDEDLKNIMVDLKNIILKIRNNIKYEGDRNLFSKDIKSLENLESNIFSRYSIFLQNLKNYSSNILNSEEINILNKSIDYIKEKISFLYSLIPVFYLYREKNLNDEYVYNDEFLKKFNSSELIYLLFKSIEIKKEDLDIIFKNPLSGDAEDMKIEINKRLKSIEYEFNQFYNQEKIKISMAFNSNKFSVFIDSTDNKMKISERSRGLRWYLNMFIDIKANDLNNKQVIYLIDEPAVFLHVEAQKEVINLFRTLVENNNQLIYATHSPYMIDSNELTRVRALEKEDGITKIHNKVYNEKLSSKSKMETLSPILDAIGLKLKYNLGPHSDMLNIVTEGITDYMYINAMIHYLNIEDIYILPSSGAENVPNIVSILMGWGVDFKALLDYDSEGNKAVKKLAKLGLKINEDYYFLNGKNEFNREEHSVVIEDLIDDSDKEKIRETYLDGDKTINARIFETKVKKGEIVPSEKTTEKFKTLFKTMGIYNENIE